MWELSQIHCFAERIECWVFKETFTERLYYMHKGFEVIDAGLDAVRDSEAIRDVLRLVLALGNHMNGGTRRGQADGFGLGIMPKVRTPSARRRPSHALTPRSAA